MPRTLGNKPAGTPLLLREDDAGQRALLGGADGRGGNVPEISVSDLSNALKRTVEDNFGYVRLRGEISNYRGPHASGHAYFCLKDEAARIDAVIWKTAFARMRFKPEEGMEVVAAGKITTFPGKSSYQIVVESLEPAGAGALMALLEDRRRRLAAEGLFDAARKKALPYLPGVIGVVTSPTGSVIRDILHRVAARFRRHVIVWPVRVQGETSAAEVVAAILGFNAHSDGSPFTRPDLIIVARGGGSLEDLWGFNEESVVRAAAGSLIPLISAVGHETDWTLIDHAADLRAPTPTGAAELALPVHAELSDALDRLRRRHASATLRRLDAAQGSLRTLVRLMPSGADLLASPGQRLDRAATHLPALLRVGHDRQRLVLSRLTNRLRSQSPQARMARAEQRLQNIGDQLQRGGRLATERLATQVAAADGRLTASYRARLRVLAALQARQRSQVEGLAGRLRRVGGLRIERGADRVAGLAQMLGSLGYRSVLARGYAVVHAPDDSAVRTPAAVKHAGRVSLEFYDGRIDVEVVRDASKGTSAERPRVAPERVKAGKLANARLTGQGTLFDP